MLGLLDLLLLSLCIGCFFSFSEVTNIGEIFDITENNNFKELFVVMNKTVEALSSNFSMSRLTAIGSSCKCNSLSLSLGALVPYVCTYIQYMQ